MIKPDGKGGYVLMSKDGTRKLGHGSHEEMVQREKQVEMFKHMKSNNKGKHSQNKKPTKYD